MNVDRRFVTFLAVGALNTAFGYGCFCLFIWMGLPYPLAVLFGTVLGVLFNFRTTGTLVFANRDNGRLWRFVGTYAVMYVVNVGALKLGLRFGLSLYLTSAVALLPLAAMSFGLNKAFVFRETP